MERSLGKAAIGSGQEIFPPCQASNTHDAFSDKLGMFDHVGGVADDARDEHLARGRLHILPHLPVVLVTRIGGLGHVGTDMHLEDDVGELLRFGERQTGEHALGVVVEGGSHARVIVG